MTLQQQLSSLTYKVLTTAQPTVPIRIYWFLFSPNSVQPSYSTCSSSVATISLPPSTVHFLCKNHKLLILAFITPSLESTACSFRQPHLNQSLSHSSYFTCQLAFCISRPTTFTVHCTFAFSLHTQNPPFHNFYCWYPITDSRMYLDLSCSLVCVFIMFQFLICAVD